ncbi:7-cyano-7-deazaguanine synthase, partial [Streptomyces sp. P17]|uniref:7-cyano-7-deazaguanine synthase n=1 Tax=Streptomyces sp. P17 TaxID=3074716 RepID=UPI0037DC3595
MQFPRKQRDCRPGFINDMQDSINSALGYNSRAGEGLEIQTPLMYLTKADTVKLALGTPFTYSALA